MAPYPPSSGWGHWRQHPSLALGAPLVLLWLLAAALGQLWTPGSAYEVNLSLKLLPPSGLHWLGTDALGRDVASMLLLGAGQSLIVGVVAVGMGLVLGTALGLVAAAQRGWVEQLVLRIADLAFAFPAVLLAIMFTALYGPSMVNAMVAIGLFNIPIFVRVARASARVVWARDFILAARVCGKGGWRITFEHILPNIAPVLLVQATVQFAVAILAEAALSYLGLGTQPPEPSWGRMLSEAQTLLWQAPLLALWPGLAMVLTVLGLNLLGDGLRDALDPRLSHLR
ncbi:ABC transporter permease [Giesbergeria sinuosa]|uniref:ABC transporter permease n=1 Tax=Giesbergeria sinuosa TaxID=80883 RepID=UPI0036D37994